MTILFPMYLLFQHFVKINRRGVFIPTALKFGIRNVKVAPPVPNDTLEDYFKEHKRLKPNEVDQLASKLNISPQMIEKWWKRRRVQGQPTTLQKFCDYSWYTLFHIFGCAYGFLISYDQPFFWDFKLSVQDFQNHVS